MVFVAIAIYLPSSHFGVILFCLGITKFLFPEIILHMWKAFEVELKVEPEEVDPSRRVVVAGLTRRSSSLQEMTAISALNHGMLASTTDFSTRNLLGDHLDTQQYHFGDTTKRFLARKMHQGATRLLETRPVEAPAGVPGQASGSSAEGQGGDRVTVELVKRMEHDPVKHVVGMRMDRSLNGLVNMCGGVGLMLHHTSMCIIFAASSLHLHEELDNPLTYDKGVSLLVARRFGLGLILVFVLLQHFVAQVVPFFPVRITLLLIIEVFFQWFSILNMYDVATTIDTIGILGLVVSHYLMAIVVFQDVLRGGMLLLHHLPLLLHNLVLFLRRSKRKNHGPEAPAEVPHQHATSQTFEASASKV